MGKNKILKGKERNKKFQFGSCGFLPKIRCKGSTRNKVIMMVLFIVLVCF